MRIFEIALRGVARSSTVTVSASAASRVPRSAFCPSIAAKRRSSTRSPIEAARWADAVVVCVGEPIHYSGEACCRADIRLPGMQAELVRAVSEVSNNMAVVLFNGRPLDLSNIYDCSPAILDMWFPGSEGGNAAAELLFGVANPCGKLAMSFPRAVGQCPVYYNRTNTGRPKTGDDNVYKPFSSGYLDCPNMPLFCFGEGGSYTEFTYESMTLDKKEMGDDDTVTVTVKITNSGDRFGKEVVQLYMRDLVGSVVRPIQELIAFKKIALEAGESAEVVFEIKEPMLRFWNAENKHASEAGEFSLFVGFADHAFFKDSFRLNK